MQVDQVDGATVVMKQYFLTWGSSDLFVIPACAGMTMKSLTKGPFTQNCCRN
jgi:hypothetical protein